MDDVVGIPPDKLEDPSDNFEAGEQIPPPFGLIDIVDAFTALRHEYRSQLKETRQLAEQLKGSTEQIQNLEASLSGLVESQPATSSGSDDQADRSAQTLVEFDIQLSRAVEAVMTDYQQRQNGQAKRNETLSQSISELSGFARWLAGPVIKAVQAHIVSESKEPSSVIDGLSILLSKLRQALRDHEIERLETTGKPFDGETMKSIGVLQVEGIASGCVAQQLAPAYVKNGRVIKYAEVRVAV